MGGGPYHWGGGIDTATRHHICICKRAPIGAPVWETPETFEYIHTYVHTSMHACIHICTCVPTCADVYRHLILSFPYREPCDGAARVSEIAGPVKWPSSYILLGSRHPLRYRIELGLTENPLPLVLNTAQSRMMNIQCGGLKI